MSHRQRQIIRMVDGELTVQEQRGLLVDCEQRDAWRDLALAYVESQALGLELKGLADGESESSLTLRSGGRGREAAKVRVPAPWHAWSLAASMLLILGLGFGLGWWMDRPAVMPNLANAPDATSEAVESVVGDLSSMQFTIADPQTNELRQIDLPTVRASTLGPNWPDRLPRAVSEDFVREMRSRGLDVRQQRMFVPVTTSNGQRVIIPVDYVDLEQKFF